jgi:hypothetical protein
MRPAIMTERGGYSSKRWRYTARFGMPKHLEIAERMQERI